MDSAISLINKVKELTETGIRRIVEERIQDFKDLGSCESKEIFKELCFCLLTANFNAERSILIQERISDGFLYMDKERLVRSLKSSGHRYPEKRAEHIVDARRYADSIKEIISSISEREGKRVWLVKHIKGIGYKEASHFLRNIGCLGFAIIDFHIIDLLEKASLIKRPKILTKKRYIEIESILRNISKQVNLSLGELDLYLWYMETGKVLK